MTTEAARQWLAERHHAVLITLRSDGTPQTSNVVTAFAGDTFRVSVTASRAKTRNLARDPRALMHVLGPDFSSYAAVRCAATLGTISTSPGNHSGTDLLALYNAISDAPHLDPEEFLEAQVTEQRLLLTLRAEDITGIGWHS